MRIRTMVLAALVCSGMSLIAFAGEPQMSIRQPDVETFDNDNANDGLPYLGVGYGRARDRYRNDGDAYHDVYKVFAGYSINKYFAVEMSYLKIANASKNSFVSANAYTRDNSSVLADVIVKLPLTDRFAPFVRIGVANLSTLTRTSTTTSTRNTRNEWAYGVGCEVNITRHFVMRAEYQAAGLGSNLFDLATISAIAKF